MTPRTSEPSERVARILEEDREPRPLELPSTLARGRYGVSLQAVIGVALVVAVAVAMLVGRYVMAREDAAPQPAVVQEEGAAAEPDGTESPFAPAAGPATTVTVHVVGRVERPGVVTLPGGSRVGEALDEAGGTTGRADLTSVNLARPLVDGEQVVVPGRGETPAAAPAPAGAPAAGAPAPGGAAAPGAAVAPVDLNTADLATLETLPGVGPVLAQRILEWRTQHGRFTAVEELGEVSGIGDKIYAQLSTRVTV
jgi:competence protein ComEA